MNNVTIIFNGIKWAVCLVPKDDPEMNSGETEVLGLTSYTTQVIRIRAGMTEIVTYQTIVHELTHAAMFSFGFSDADFNIETICNFMGAYINQIYDAANTVINVFFSKD